MHLKPFLTMLLLIAAPLTAANAQTNSVVGRGTIRVITDVLIPTGLANQPRATLPQANDQVLGCPAGYQRSNYAGQFAICLDTVCKGRKPLCVKYETISPDALLDGSPSVATKAVVWRLRPSLTACGANSILAGKMPNCSTGSCSVQRPWNVCADRRELDLRSGGSYLSDLKVTAHGLHRPSPPCPAGLGVAAGFADGGGGYLWGNQRICQGSSNLAPRQQPPPPERPAPIRITQFPADAYWNGSPVMFSVRATTTRPNTRLSYQWYKVGHFDQLELIPGATSSDMTVSSPPLESGYERFEVRISGPGLTPRTLTVNLLMPYRITEEPADQVSDGGWVVFSVGAVSNRNRTLSYRWFQKIYRWEGAETQVLFAPIPGATGRTLRIDSSPEEARSRSSSGSTSEYYVEVSAEGVAFPIRSRTAKMSWVPPGAETGAPTRIDCEMLPTGVAPSERSGLIGLSVPLGCSINRALPLIPRWSICLEAFGCRLVDGTAAPAASVSSDGELAVLDLFYFFRTQQRNDELMAKLLGGNFYIDLSVSVAGGENFQAPRINVLPPGVGEPARNAPPALSVLSYEAEAVCFQDTDRFSTAIVVEATINRSYQENLVSFSWETRASERESWRPINELGSLVNGPTQTYRAVGGAGQEYPEFESVLRLEFNGPSRQQVESLWGPREFRIAVSSSLPDVPPQLVGPISIVPRSCRRDEPGRYLFDG